MRKGQSAEIPDSAKPITGSCAAPGLASRGQGATSRDGVGSGRVKGMFLPRLAFAACLVFAPLASTQTVAETVAEPPVAAVTISELCEVLRLDELFDVLRAEGLAHGETLQADMFPSGGGPAWSATVAQIYDLPRLRAAFNQQLRAALGQDPAAMSEIAGFFGSDLGGRILTLEIEARRAFLDTTVEEAAQVAADKRRADRDPQARQIDRFIEAGDLLEMNVAGALSGNLAFLTGLNEAGVNGPPLPQDELLSQVWGQEGQIRDTTQVWLQSYLGMAYDPLTEDEMDAYIAFWESPAGQRLNAALFVAFDTVFSGVSQDLGRAAGTAMLGQDI
jgi:hypothetical protein